MAEIIMLEEASNPSAPGTGKWKLFFKSDGIYIIDDAGSVSGPFGTAFTQEQIEDFIGAMVTGNTETGIAVTYDDGTAKLNFVAEVTQSELDTTNTNLSNHLADTTDAHDGGAISYTPAENTDWASGADPGHVDDALDQLADRVKKGETFCVFNTISDPAGYFNNDRAQVPLFDSFLGALTITAIRVRGNDSTPTSELAGDLKFADDIFTGSLANATVIDVCDTTSAAFTATASFDDATVPANKFIYFQMDAAPHADWKEIYISVYYTRD